MEPLNLEGYESIARERLPRADYEYFAGAAGDGHTLRRNRSAYDCWRLRPRVLIPVGSRTLTTTLLGLTLPTPILVAPMAFQKLAHPDGELASVRAAATAGVTFTASTMATHSLEEIATATTAPKFFQLYVFKDRGITRSLIERAEAAGYQAVQVTADVPVMGRREADIHNRFSLPDDLVIKNLVDNNHGSLTASESESGPALYTKYLFDADLSWRDLEWFCSLTKLPILLKGVLRGDDAAKALDHGAAGVVVSNHGGRQLDTSLATIEALPDIVQAIGGRGTIIVDGGIRRGIDVIKALALGANAVQVGRPVIWGLAVNGQAGAERVLLLLREELDNALALCGCPTIGAITRDLLVRV